MMMQNDCTLLRFHTSH